MLFPGLLGICWVGVINMVVDSGPRWVDLGNLACVCMYVCMYVRTLAGTRVCMYVCVTSFACIFR